MMVMLVTFGACLGGNARAEEGMCVRVSNVYLYSVCACFVRTCTHTRECVCSSLWRERFLI